jgi:hypothetical protein
MSFHCLFPFALGVCTQSTHGRFSVYLHNRTDWHSKGVSTVYCLLHCPRGLLNGKEFSLKKEDGGGRHGMPTEVGSKMQRGGQ